MRSVLISTAAQFESKGGELKIVEKQIEEPKEGHVLVKTLAWWVSRFCYCIFTKQPHYHDMYNTVESATATRSHALMPTALGFHCA